MTTLRKTINPQVLTCKTTDVATPDHTCRKLEDKYLIDISNCSISCSRYTYLWNTLPSFGAIDINQIVFTTAGAPFSFLPRFTCFNLSTFKMVSHIYVHEPCLLKHFSRHFVIIVQLFLLPILSRVIWWYIHFIESVDILTNNIYSVKSRFMLKITILWQNNCIQCVISKAALFCFWKRWTLSFNALRFDCREPFVYDVAVARPSGKPIVYVCTVHFVENYSNFLILIAVPCRDFQQHEVPLFTPALSFF